MRSVVDNQNLHLGDSSFKVVKEMRELGLNVSTDRSVKGAPKIIDKWGYFFRPELNKLCSLAYRIQSLKFHYPPQFVRQIVLSYFCGIVRYGSCLYYHRSLESDLDRLRFYYTMACSAILRISTIDVVKATCCKSMAVKKDNKNYLKLLKMVGLPSFVEMAQKDSVSATRQVFLLKPDFFVDKPVAGGRPRRVVRQLFRFGVEAGKKNSNDSEKVKKAGLPSSLSKDVISSGAIIGDICRLAWAFLDRQVKPNTSSEYEYESYLRLAKKCHLQDGELLNYVEIFGVFEKLCLSAFEALEMQDRRFNFIESLDIPKKATMCKVSPPAWYGSRDKKATNRLFYSCYHSPPEVDDDSGTVLRDLSAKDICGICGYYVNTVNLHIRGAVKCISCKRRFHRKCVNELAVKPLKFKCSLVKRHLGRDGVELMEPELGIRSAPLLRSQLCLICGEGRVGFVETIFCSENCGYGAHDYCIALQSLVKRELGGDSSDEFRCSEVSYQFKRCEVDDCVNFVDGRLTRERRNRRRRWNFVDVSVEALVEISRKRGRVNVNSYSLRQQRWENEDTFCDLCKRWVGLDERDHFESWCTGIGGTFTSSSSTEYILSRCKRFRHMVRGANVV